MKLDNVTIEYSDNVLKCYVIVKSSSQALKSCERLPNFCVGSDECLKGTYAIRADLAVQWRSATIKAHVSQPQRQLD